MTKCMGDLYEHPFKKAPLGAQVALARPFARPAPPMIA